MMTVEHHVAPIGFLHSFSPNVSSTPSRFDNWWQQIRIIFTVPMLFNLRCRSVQPQLKLLFLAPSVRILTFGNSIALLLWIRFKFSNIDSWWIICGKHPWWNSTQFLLLVLLWNWNWERLYIDFMHTLGFNFFKSYLFNFWTLGVHLIKRRSRSDVFSSHKAFHEILKLYNIFILYL